MKKKPAYTIAPFKSDREIESLDIRDYHPAMILQKIFEDIFYAHDLEEEEIEEIRKMFFYIFKKQYLVARDGTDLGKKMIVNIPHVGYLFPHHSVYLEYLDDFVNGETDFKNENEVIVRNKYNSMVEKIIDVENTFIIFNNKYFNKNDGQRINTGTAYETIKDNHKRWSEAFGKRGIFLKNLNNQPGYVHHQGFLF